MLFIILLLLVLLINANSNRNNNIKSIKNYVNNEYNSNTLNCIKLLTSVTVASRANAISNDIINTKINTNDDIRSKYSYIKVF